MGPADKFALLSNRERDVIGLLAEGLTNESIARRLGIAPRTVEKHVARVFRKLDLPDETATNRRVAAVVSWLARDR